MLNRTQYNRLSRLTKALVMYLTLHPEATNWTVSEMIEHLTQHDLPKLAPKVEPRKPSARKPRKSTAAPESCAENSAEKVDENEKEKPKKKNPLPSHTLPPKEKEINKEKEFFTLSLPACEGEVRDEILKKADTASKFEDWSEDDFRQQVRSFENRYSHRLLRMFFNYWADRTSNGQMRFQLQNTFDVEKRLEVWAAKEPLFGKTKHETAEAMPENKLCSQFALNQERLPKLQDEGKRPNASHTACSGAAFDFWENGAPLTTDDPFDQPAQHTEFVRGEQSLPPL